MTPIRVSVLIVSYNAKEFLHLCLTSIYKCRNSDEAEVVVIDNASGDGSVGEIRTKFPRVNLICNKTNLGFTRACNQGAEAATGEYLIFLNPDTLLPAHALQACTAALSESANAGGVGVNLYDGSGKYLRESARRVPTPLNALSN